MIRGQYWFYPAFQRFWDFFYIPVYKNIVHEKQFGFQSGYSTNDPIVQLVENIFDSFEKEEFTLGVFIDLSKAFDIVNNSSTFI